MHERPPGSAGVRPDRRAESVRVVEDRLLVREIVRTVLERSGHAAREGAQGPGASRAAVAAFLEPFTNPVLLARVRALADVP